MGLLPVSFINHLGANSALANSALLAICIFLGCASSTAMARTMGSFSDPHSADSYHKAALVSATAILLSYFSVSSSKNKKTDSEEVIRPNYPLDKDGYPAVNNDKTLTWREDRGISKLVPLHPEKKDGKPLKKYTMAEVAKRSTPAEAWIVIDERVYDITNFAGKHPGGEKVLWAMAGRDATDSFANYHAATVYKKWLPPYLIGEVTDVPVYPHVQDFRNIRQELLRRGLFETDPTYYYKMYAWYATIFITSLYLTLVCESTLAHMSGAVMMGLFWQQIAGWGHDVGHSSVTHDFQHDALVGAKIGNALMGISVGWWKRSHNTHHVVCNSIEHDPDIQHMPVLAVTPEIMKKPFWSTYHDKVVAVDAFARFFIRHQHILFLPIMAVARFNLYAQSWILILTTTNKDYKIMYNRLTEVTSLILFAGWVTGVCLSLPTWKESLGWLMLSHGTSALLHVQICLSHFSMHTYHGNAYNDASDEWYKMQLKTSMNVDCHKWLDWFHIGLQFQVEHHLFPTLPRHNLRIARDMVREVCKKHGIEYHEQTFFQGVLKTILCLRETALRARAGDFDYAVDSKQIRDLLNANG